MNKDNYIHTPYNDEWIAQRADPFVYRHTDGTYYFTASVPAYDRIILCAANDLGGLVHAEEKTLWVRHESGPAEHPYLGTGDSLSVWRMVYLLCSRG